jgi:hypothetical protein
MMNNSFRRFFFEELMVWVVFDAATQISTVTVVKVIEVDQKLQHEPD